MTNNFRSVAACHAAFGEAFNEAKFVLRIRRYDVVQGKPDPMYTMVIVRDMDNGTERNIIEGGLSFVDQAQIRNACEQVKPFRRVLWDEFPKDVQTYVMYNILPLEWHGAEEDFLVTHCSALVPMGTEMERPYDQYDDPYWLMDNGCEEEAAEIFQSRGMTLEQARAKQAEDKAKAEGMVTTPLDEV